MAKLCHERGGNLRLVLDHENATHGPISILTVAVEIIACLDEEEMKYRARGSAPSP
jgi:hypothetical protein